MSGRCIAYTAAGAPCGCPGVVVDVQRGGLVCQKHRPDRNDALLAAAALSGSRCLLVAWAVAEMARQLAEPRPSTGTPAEPPF